MPHRVGESVRFRISDECLRSQVTESEVHHDKHPFADELKGQWPTQQRFVCNFKFKLTQVEGSSCLLLSTANCVTQS